MLLHPTWARALPEELHAALAAQVPRDAAQRGAQRAAHLRVRASVDSAISVSCSCVSVPGPDTD